MSSFLSKRLLTFCLLALLLSVLAACDGRQLNNPYPAEQDGKAILYQSFDERPKHLDPAVAYSENEYAFIAQIYEPPFQYHYLKRPYQLVPLTAAKMPEIRYLDKSGHLLTPNADSKDIAFTDYLIDLQPNVQFQPHPALAKNGQGDYLYHRLTKADIGKVNKLTDFEQSGTRALTAEDYVYQIKRLAHPKTQSPIAEMMKNYIVGFGEFSEQVKSLPKTAIKEIPLSGVTVTSPTQYRIRINGKYPQFMYWLAMSFFAPMPWEADVFYRQPGLSDKNITLDWYPIGTGAYYLAENNPNRRMVLTKNPNFHLETYPAEGEAGDLANGLLVDAGKPLPFIEQVIFSLEKETIPRWTKFLQGYFDASGIASDSFDQAVQFSQGKVELTPSMQAKQIHLQTSIETSLFYMGFNMLDKTVGGDTENARKLRQAIAIAIDNEEYISIFRNGRGEAPHGVIPPGIFGYREGKAKRKSQAEARLLMKQAGYENGIDPSTGQALILNIDTTSSGVDDRPRLSWYRKQFAKLGINLVIRDTDFNRFQDKLRTGNLQIFTLGWNADYPDPENFFFLLYGGNAKVKFGGENASNYRNPEFDRRFEQMRNMDNNAQRFQQIQEMEDILRRDMPWVVHFFPKQFTLSHRWFSNRKPHAMANNGLKYLRIDAAARARQREAWNQAAIWPVFLTLVLMGCAVYFGRKAYLQRTNKKLQ